MDQSTGFMPLVCESASESSEDDQAGPCLAPGAACSCVEGDLSHDDMRKLAAKFEHECLTKDGLFPKYDRREYKDDKLAKQDSVDCSRAIKVYVDMRPQELKRIDDENEQFGLVFVLKLWWRDPRLKNFKAQLCIEKEAPNTAPFLEEIDVVVRELHEDGTLVFEDFQKLGSRQTRKKHEYVSISPPKWENHFFPKHTFINQVDAEAQGGIHIAERQLLWCNEAGGVVEYKAKYDRVFEETLELKEFPMDRQLCRVKLTAESPVSDFQFIAIDTCRRLSKVTDMWETSKEEDHPECIVYVRHVDRILPSSNMIQRSLVNMVLHVRRKPDFFYHSVWLMVALINGISLCSFAIRPSHHSGRLSYLSTCFLAVLAYRYIINDSLPKKSYTTYADQYIISACAFQAVLCLWSSILMFCWRVSEDQDEHLDPDTRGRIVAADVAALGLATFAFILLNCQLLSWWRIARFHSWQEVYERTTNKEPYFPVDECKSCGGTFLSQQHCHADPNKRCQNSDCKQQNIHTHYLTPKNVPEDMRSALLPSLKDRLKRHGPADEVEEYLAAHA